MIRFLKWMYVVLKKKTIRFLKWMYVVLNKKDDKIPQVDERRPKQKRR